MPIRPPAHTTFFPILITIDLYFGFVWSTELDYGGAKKPTRCLLDRARSLTLDVTPSNGNYIPKCKDDGSYDPVQCHVALNQCWCVDRFGNELHGTRQTSGTPDCSDVGEYNVHLRIGWFGT